MATETNVDARGKSYTITYTAPTKAAPVSKAATSYEVTVGGKTAKVSPALAAKLQADKTPIYEVTTKSGEKIATTQAPADISKSPYVTGVWDTSRPVSVGTKPAAQIKEFKDAEGKTVAVEDPYKKKSYAAPAGQFFDEKKLKESEQAQTTAYIQQKFIPKKEDTWGLGAGSFELTSKAKLKAEAKERFMSGQTDYPVRILGISPEEVLVKQSGVFFGEKGEKATKSFYYHTFIRPAQFGSQLFEKNILMRQRTPGNMFFEGAVFTTGAVEGATKVWSAPVSTILTVAAFKGGSALLSGGLSSFLPKSVIASLPSNVITKGIGGAAVGELTKAGAGAFFLSGLGARSASGGREPLGGLGQRFGEGYVFYGTEKIIDVGLSYGRTVGLKDVPKEKIMTPKILSGAEKFPLGSPQKHYSMFLKGEYQLPIGEKRIPGTAKFETVYPKDLSGSPIKLPTPSGWHTTRGELRPVVEGGSSEIAGLYVSSSVSPAFLRIKNFFSDYPRSIYETFTNLEPMYYAGEPLIYNVKPSRGYERISPKELIPSADGKTKFELPEYAVEGRAYVPGLKIEVEGIYRPGTELKNIRAEYRTTYLAERVKIKEVEAVGTGKGDYIVSKEGNIISKATKEKVRLVSDVSPIKTGFGKSIWTIEDAIALRGGAKVSSAKSSSTSSWGIRGSSSKLGASSVSFIPSSASSILSTTSRTSSVTSKTSSVSRISSSLSSITSLVTSRPSSATSTSSIISRVSSSASSSSSSSSAASSITRPLSSLIPSLNLGLQAFGRRPTKRVKFKPTYVASIEAVAFGIKGKRPGAFEISTGLNIRPMVR